MRAACALVVPTSSSSLLIVGADAVLAAAPSTAVQLTHACLAGGFDAVIPATWGEELIAAYVADRLDRADGPLLQCTCPLVARRLATHGEVIADMTVCTVSPPVAAAAYLRAICAPERPHITYAGGCEGARDDVVDAVLSPAELLALLTARGVALAAQPREFDARLAPDRRRFHSDPGGVPATSVLRRRRNVECVEVSPEDFVTELAQYLLERRPLLIDAAGAMGCACSGAVAGPESGQVARARVREQEPPRAPGPVMDDALAVTLSADLPAPIDMAVVVPNADVGATPTGAEPVAIIAEIPRRRSPMGTRKSVLGVMPQARTDRGRQLPRAYVARRRSSPKGVAAQRQPGAGAARLHGRWPYVAAAGVAVGLALAWLVGLLR